MRALIRIDRMESELNNDRLTRIAAKKAKAQRDKWRARERVINTIISGRRYQCFKANQLLIVEG